MLKKKGIATLLFLFNFLFIFAEDALFLKSISYSAQSTNDLKKQPAVEYSKTPQTESQQAVLSTSYKRYSLCRYGELYILCEPYIVKRGDWVYKIFRSKGELSKEDFGLFMRIFKKINPKINNTNKIEVGQKITIPLKKSKKSDFKEISPGVVELPIITLSQVPEATKIVTKPLPDKNILLSSKPEPPPIAKPEPKTSEISSKIEPEPIAKSELKMPEISSKPTTPSIAKSELKTSEISPKSERSSIAKSEPETKLNSPIPTAPIPPISQLKQFATLHNGQLMLRGKYYFPRNNGDDLVVDVSLNPLMQFKNGSKILFVDDKDKFEGLIDTIKEFWRDFKIMEFKDVSSYGEGETSSYMELNPANSYKNRTLPYDNNLQSKYDDKKTLYNKPFSQLEENAYVPINIMIQQDHKSAVKQLLAIANYQYTPEKEIDISVGNIVVKATPGLITRNGKPNILIVFGDIYGSAFETLKKNQKGHIVTISPLLTTIDVAKRLFSALGASTTENPSFVNPDDGRAISIEGIYINSDNTELFITHRPTLLKEAFRYLTSKEITILRVDN
ncbi:MAG: LysM peptidoglycan-binding domain-containing protein [Desulfamplus sp.]|nr:LysM peptidoglycan-binding domain-containing protein [Desulfamplus sp.]